ncbi:MAG TPA: glycosyltransferase family 39 protein [Burkholderiales bacterium]|nr:glycosyltransferase family 39 protein [Burkholderiales bacterium]
MTGAPSLRRWFWTVLAVVLAFRLWFAWWLPFTGDEAYFLTWARAPDLGFYDHPPMIGWMLAGLLEVSQSALWLRLPSVLLPALIAVGMVALIRALAGSNMDSERIAYAGALAWMLVPAQVVNVLVTTDTPLIAFSALAMGAFAVAVRRDSTAAYVAAGAALGLAFLSKYFALLVGLAFAVFALASSLARDPTAPRIWRGVAVTVLALAPFALVNLAWNYGHCWTNVLFNVYNRHDEARLRWWRPFEFAALVVYVSSPILLWQLARDHAALRSLGAVREWRLLATLALAPLAVFAAIAPFRDVGLHWLFSFMAPLFAAGALALGADRLLTSVKYLATLSAAHVALALTVAAVPIETFQWLPQYNSMVQTAKADELLAALKAYEGKYLLAANSFSRAARLSYAAARANFVTQPQAPEAWRRHYVFVLGSTSHHGRQDDIFTDARTLEGRDVLVVQKQPADLQQYRRWFRAVALRDIEIGGTTFHLVLGHDFDFAAYRESLLAQVRDRYYRVPRILDRGHCYFCQRYFGTRTCPLR